MSRLLSSLLAPALACWMLPALASAQVDLPQEGAALSYLHVPFRWDSFATQLKSLGTPTGQYRLQVVEDDGSANPFASGALMEEFVPLSEPRAVITAGLEFGRTYYWRVKASTLPGPVQRTSGVRRFTTQPLPTSVPIVQVQTFGGPLQPGLTLYNMTPSATPFDGFFLAIDATGKYVFFEEFTQQGANANDVRITPNGRLLSVQRGSPTGPGGRAVEQTLNGKEIWMSRDEQDAAGNDLYSVHHEAFEMPNGDRLLLLFDFRSLANPLTGFMETYRGHRIAQFRRQTDEIVWQWNAYDYLDLGDFGINSTSGNPYTPADWLHANAAVYNPFDNSVYLSLRNVSRILRIDYGTRNIVYQMGEMDPPANASGQVDFGDNLFTNQHAPDMLPNGHMMVYDNANLNEPLSAPRQSRAIELAFSGSPSAPTGASIVWEYPIADLSGHPVFTPFVGDADRLANGNTLVTVGRNSVLDEVDSASPANLLWRAVVGQVFPNNLVYRAERIPQLVVDAPGDSDGDWDLDLRDLAQLQIGFTQPQTAGLAFPLNLSDFDRDGDLDDSDTQAFLAWMTGPAR